MMHMTRKEMLCSAFTLPFLGDIPAETKENTYLIYVKRAWRVRWAFVCNDLLFWEWRAFPSNDYILGTVLPHFSTNSKEVCIRMGVFLSALGVLKSMSQSYPRQILFKGSHPWRVVYTSPELPKIPTTTPKARMEFIYLMGFHFQNPYRNDNPVSWTRQSGFRDHNDIRRNMWDAEWFIRQYSETDPYLTGYARLHLLIWRNRIGDKVENLPSEFQQLEDDYANLPELGLMAAWWRAITLAYDDKEGALQSFAHVATKYKDTKLWIVEAASKASQNKEEWSKLNLFYK